MEQIWIHSHRQCMYTKAKYDSRRKVGVLVEYKCNLQRQ